MKLEFSTLDFEDLEKNMMSMLQSICDIVQATHLGGLQNMDFYFDQPSPTALYNWPASPDVLKKAAILEDILLSTPSKPKITIDIPSLKHQHAESIFETARKLFPHVDQAGALFVSPTRE